MTNDLEIATRVRPVGDDLFEGEVPDGWQQGRGAYGGLTIASMVRAIEAFADSSDRTLRSLTAELPGPTLLGTTQIRPELLRAGSAQSTLTARLTQEGEVRAICVAVLGRARATSVGEHCELVPPELKPWREIEPFPLRFGAPTFTQNFEFRSDGPMPLSGSSSARALGWVRPRAAAAAMSGASYLAALADVWWPALFARTTTMSPVATVAYTLQILGTCEAFDPELPFAYRAHTWALRQGYFVEQRELWSEHGELLALNQQTFAVIK